MNITETKFLDFRFSFSLYLEPCAFSREGFDSFGVAIADLLIEKLVLGLLLPHSDRETKKKKKSEKSRTFLEFFFVENWGSNNGILWEQFPGEIRNTFPWFSGKLNMWNVSTKDGPVLMTIVLGMVLYLLAKYFEIPENCANIILYSTLQLNP